MPASRISVYLSIAIAILAALPLAASTPYGNLPLTFEKNEGQFDSSVRFLSRGSGYAVFLTQDELVLRLSRARGQRDDLRWQLKGADRNAPITGESLLETKSNYLRGNDPAQWRKDVANYAKVRRANVYPGIDVVYHGNQRGNQRQLEYDFEIAPNASPSRIRMAVRGAKSMRLGANGELVMQLAHGDVVQPRPEVYQEANGKRERVDGRYVLRGRNEVGFVLGTYDRTRPVVIDPVVHYSTYLGGNLYDNGIAVAVDGSGNAYMTGLAESTNFPTANAIQSADAFDYDAYVAKVNAAGTALVYSTYLGGNGGNEYGLGIALDGSNNVYVVGATNSTNFPGVTGSSIQPAFGGSSRDAFLTKINAAGNAIVYSTYLGGSGDEVGYGIEVDGSGNAYVSGSTGSTDFPLSSALQSTYGGGAYDAFVAKVNSAGTALTWSTYLGDTGNDQSLRLALDSSNNPLITGTTDSTSFPGVTGSSIQSSNGGGAYDGYVTKLNSAGSSITWSTFLGTSSDDFVADFALDGSDNVYVGGFTAATSFPGVSGGSLQSSNGGSTDAFLTKINAGGTAITWSTFFGSTGDDYIQGLTVDSSSYVYIAGGTTSTTLPGITGTSMQPANAGDNDAFYSKINAAGTSITWSTFYGGASTDVAYDVALDGSGNLYSSGFTFSTDFPVTPGALQTTLGGDGDAFLVKIGEPGNPVVTSISPGSGRNGDQITINGYNFDNYQGANGQVWLGSKNAGSIVSWNNRQIVATIASGSVTGSASVKQNGVWSNSVALTVLTPVITSVTPTTAISGDQITINGNYFGASGTTAQVWLGNKIAGSIVSWSDTQVVATVANGASSGSVQIMAGGVWYNYGAFTVITPVVTSLSPTSGPVGTQVTINGTGFRAAQGTGLVWLGTKYATVVSWSDTQVVATVASGSATGGTQVFQGGVWSNAVTFTVTP
jgi:IPT/TIG domain/Beta-propeller repeat